MMNSTRRGSAGALLLVLLSAAGCGPSGPPLAQVEGTVRLNGRPLAGALVRFLPDVEKQTTGREASGLTDENGRFALMYDDPRDPRPGAVVGWHVVLVSDPELENLDNPQRFQRPKIPPSYKMVTTSQLRKEVTAGTNQVIDIDIDGTAK